MARRTTRTVLTEADGGIVRRSVLPSGLRIVTEQVPGVRSVTFGIWVGVGSRDETPSQAGAAHYLEHLLFKGTRRRTALDISASIDRVGGEMNAFTAKEYTCFYARVLDEDAPTAVDVVCDVVTDALLLQRDIDSERGVILEEIAMRDDDPADLVHEEFGRVLFGETPLGRSILGTVETIEALDRRGIASFYRRNYRPERMVVAASGNIDHTALVRMVEKAFDRAGLLDGESDPVPSRDSRASRARVRAPQTLVVQRPTEQAHLVLGVPGLRRTDPRRYAVGVLNAALGGGMSSRLFQSVREQRGLAYSVYSFDSHYSDAGCLAVYAGCLPTKVDEVVSLCREELEAVRDHGLTADEIERGKGQLRGGMVLGQEDTGSRMTRIAKSELMYDEFPSLGEILRRISAVTPEDVREIAAELLSVEPSMAVIGPVGSVGV